MADDDAAGSDDNKRKKTKPGAPVNTGFNLYTQGTLDALANANTPPGTPAGTSAGTPAAPPVVAPPPAVAPAVPAAVPNPLTAGSSFEASEYGGPSGAANAYRNLPDTATPAERASAMANYKAAVAYKPPVTATAENLAAAPFSPQATERDWMPSATKYAGWTEAPGSLNQQAIAQANADQNVRAYHQAIQNAHDLERHTYDAHGRLEKPAIADLVEATRLRRQATDEGARSAYLDPQSLSADPNIDRARAGALAQLNQARAAAQAQIAQNAQVAQNRLQKDPSTLSGLADLDDLIVRHRQQQLEAENFAARKPVIYNM